VLLYLVVKFVVVVVQVVDAGDFAGRGCRGVVVVLVVEVEGAVERARRGGGVGVDLEAVGGRLVVQVDDAGRGQLVVG